MCLWTLCCCEGKAKSGLEIMARTDCYISVLAWRVSADCGSYSNGKNGETYRSFFLYRIYVKGQIFQYTMANKIYIYTYIIVCFIG